MPARLLSLFLVLPVWLSLAGCTAQAWYESARLSAETECRKLPPGGYEDCMSRVNRQPYETYEQERTRK